ncbi:YwpF family protein [Psychrobacillus psychrodurans]|uniref:YwpF-like family protein n=1 Tax=Psychrobacillus psychrodurans TaxID=126157 RepID=A0A9X3R9B3_9BACI|nr:YwpF family protein [Psychrobacillus psychrodurans]MCZ8532067.1 YwpF-like family protein [Psychrobacillus psychrodurans]
MKTFKMISVSIISDNEEVPITLEDGIVINQENSSRSWILELFTDQKYENYFNELKTSNKVYDVKVIISYPENEPAHFEVVTYSVKQIGNHLSVLLRGTLKRVRRKYAESLLSELIEEGLTGEDLLSKFENDMKTRPALKKDQ